MGVRTCWLRFNAASLAAFRTSSGETSEDTSAPSIGSSSDVMPAQLPSLKSQQNERGHCCRLDGVSSAAVAVFCDLGCHPSLFILQQWRTNFIVTGCFCDLQSYS